jgi:hypothetical protein
MDHLRRPDDTLILDPAEASSDRLLRRVLGVDAVLCAASGLLLLGASGRIGGWMRWDSAAPIALVGIALLVLANALVLGARAGGRAASQTAAISAGLDAAWVAGSLAFAVMVSMPGWMAGVVVAQAGVVGGFAYAKYRLVPRERRSVRIEARSSWCRCGAGGSPQRGGSTL